MAVQRTTSDTFVAIPGYNQWVRGLAAVSKDLAREVQVENKQVAEEVAAEARQAAGSHSRQYAKAAAGIRARGRRNAAALALLVRRYPWILGAEFGAKYHRQFKPWTGNQWNPQVGPAGGVGYVVYPTIRRLTPQIVEGYADRVERRIAAAWATKTPSILGEIAAETGGR